MPLQRITGTMNLDEVYAVWHEWLDLHNECFDLAKQHPEQAKAAWANFIKAWCAAHHGIALTDRAVFKLMEDDHAELSTCPHETGTDAASTWQALQFAIELGNTTAIHELTYKLTRLTHATTHPPQANTHRLDGAPRNAGPVTDHTLDSAPDLPGERQRHRIMRKPRPTQ
jgi:hypothetical protein